MFKKKEKKKGGGGGLLSRMQIRAVFTLRLKCARV